MKDLDTWVEELDLIFHNSEEKTSHKDHSSLSFGGSSPPEPPIDCFMQLTLPDIENRDRISEVKGRFHTDSSGHTVKFLLDQKAKRPAILRCVQYNKVLNGLLQFLSRHEYQMTLMGVAVDGHFLVHEMHILSGQTDPKLFPSPPFYLRDELLQILLIRTLEQKEPMDELPSCRQSLSFSTQGELTALFEACPNRYPPNIQEWARTSFAALSNAHLGSADKRHILKSLTYILNIDWSMAPPEIPDARTVRNALDQQFFGLERVKDGIMQAVAQIRQNRSLPKWGILLNGPAGVGKTSIANAISAILGMPRAYLEFSVLRDSEALTGTSRIYENGKPGMILEQIYAKRTASLVMVLNEIDKAAGRERGENPLDVLLPLLDGMGFTDTYIETHIPTQGIFFIATCNDTRSISKPILDRFYRIDIPTYGANEKREIFDRFVLPKVMRRSGLENQLKLSEAAREKVFCHYALEPGVRDLERIAEKLVSDFLLRRECEGLERMTYSPQDIRSLLGPAKSLSRAFTQLPGMAVGAFCYDGSAYPYHVQAILRPGEGTLELVNVLHERQKAYCKMAYECANRFMGNRLSQYTVVLGVTRDLPDLPENFLGAPGCAAIISALYGTTYAPDVIFLGGCDFFGNLYLDDKTLDPYLKCLPDCYSTLYGPLGIGELVYDARLSRSMNLVEAPNMSVLMALSSHSSGQDQD